MLNELSVLSLLMATFPNEFFSHFGKFAQIAITLLQCHCIMFCPSGFFVIKSQRSNSSPEINLSDEDFGMELKTEFIMEFQEKGIIHSGEM